MSPWLAGLAGKFIKLHLIYIIGGITGAIEISITYPTEYAKTVMQLYPEKNAMGVKKVFTSTYAENGFFGLYRGYSALLLFSIPKNTVRFGAY